MPIGSLNEFVQLIVKEGTTPATPSAGDQKLFINSSTHHLNRVNSAGAVTDLEGGSVALTTASAKLSADVTASTANVFYDGPSVTVAAGTWIIWSGLLVLSVGSVNMTAKLWDGTTVENSTEATNNGGGAYYPFFLGGVVSPGTSKTYKMSFTGNVGGNVITAAAPTNGAGNNACFIYAIKIG